MKKFFIILIATVTSYNCESDDICPESTLTTPRMIITFYDVNNPEERKFSLNFFEINFAPVDFPVAAPPSQDI